MKFLILRKTIFEFSDEAGGELLNFDNNKKSKLNYLSSFLYIF